MGVMKTAGFIYFITFKSIFLKSVHSGSKTKTISSHHWRDIIGLYFISFCMWQFPLTSNTGGCWNILESTLAMIPLIGSSRKWTRIIFIISNSKLGIWYFSHPRIYGNSQSNLYGVLTDILGNRESHLNRTRSRVISPIYKSLWDWSRAYGYGS